jgi:hypothetical protein
MNGTLNLNCTTGALDVQCDSTSAAWLLDGGSASMRAGWITGHKGMDLQIQATTNCSAFGEVNGATLTLYNNGDIEINQTFGEEFFNSSTITITSGIYQLALEGEKATRSGGIIIDQINLKISGCTINVLFNNTTCADVLCYGCNESSSSVNTFSRTGGSGAASGTIFSAWISTSSIVTLYNTGSIQEQWDASSLVGFTDISGGRDVQLEKN